MSDQKTKQPATDWPSQLLVDDAQRAWKTATSQTISHEEARAIVLGLANLFDVVGDERLAQEKAEA